jgi:hypothetical protein
LIHFIVVTGRPDAVNRYSARLLEALESTRLFEGERVERRGAAGTWAAAAITVPDPLSAERLAATDDSIVVVNGPALDTRGNQTQLASRTL